MKFLTLLRFKPGLAPNPQMAIAVNNAVKEWIKANTTNKVLDCSYNVVPNHSGIYGMGITNASSMEEVFAQLASYPGYAITDFEVLPLSDVNQAIDKTTAVFQQMAAMMR